ncbi:MAG: serine hydrolase [Flavobacteriaceae bacterium]|nr:serine hydrolase [Flavobacteriaceae bacterium]
MKLHSNFLLCLILLIGCQKNKNYKLNEGGIPEKEGVSSERLERIDQYINKAIADTIIPGAVALVARNGKIIYHKAFGYENTSEKIQLNKNNIFRIASMSKAITSLAVMMLWEEGKFSLDDPIEKFIPEFKNSKILDKFNPKDSTYTTINVKNKITIRHLLTHTSGIGYGFIDSNPAIRAIHMKAGIIELYTTEEITIAENIKRLAKLPLHFDPGTNYTYSEGLDVLGYFIEIQSGMSFSNFLQERIFKPLQMKDTYFYLPQEKSDRLVSVQTKENGQWKDFSDSRFEVDYPIKGSKTFFSGGAGLSSTTEDYAKFLQMFLNKGKYGDQQLIGKKTCETILSNQLSHLGEMELSLAFGLLSEKEFYKGNGGSVGTFTWGGYWNTQYFADPKENIIGIIYKQTWNIGNDPTGSGFRRLVFQSIIE